MNPFMIAGAASGAIGGLANIFSGLKMQREARGIKPDYYGINDPRLQGMESQQAKDMLGRAQMQVNARAAGAAARDRQIQTGLAGTQAAVRRGAVDPSMAMQAILASQAQAGDQMNQATLLDNQVQAQREANLMNAQGVMIGERDKALAEKNMKYQMDMSQKNALRSAGQQAISSGIAGIGGALTGFGANQQSQQNIAAQNGLMQQMYGAIGAANAANYINGWGRPPIKTP